MCPILPVPTMPAVLPCRSQPTRPSSEKFIPHPVEGAMHLSIQGQQHPDGVLGHRVRGVDRNPCDRELQFPGGGEIQIVEPSAAQGHKLHALGGQRRQTRSAQPVIDEDRDGLGAASGMSGIGFQAKIEKSPIDRLGAFGVPE